MLTVFQHLFQYSPTCLGKQTHSSMGDKAVEHAASRSEVQTVSFVHTCTPKENNSNKTGDEGDFTVWLPRS